jgi:hypothetical protein
MPDEITAVRERVCLLEAREACVSTLNEYLHYLDGEFTDDLLALFTPDAQLEVMNYPPGSGMNLDLRGHEQIRPVYREHRGIMSRHHAANVAVNVSRDARSAELSAYFLTAIDYGLTGGLYEARLEPRDGKWRLAWLRISSTWGWVLPQEAPPFLSEHLGAGTLRGGRPVVYDPPSEAGELR